MTRADQPCDAPGRPRFSISVPAAGQRPACGILTSLPANAMLGGNIPLENLTRALTTTVQRPVIDRTGLTGEFDVVLRFARDGTINALPPGVPPPATDDLPDIFTAIREQLGLKLESTRAPLDDYIIERVEVPSN